MDSDPARASCWSRRMLYVLLVCVFGCSAADVFAEQDTRFDEMQRDNNLRSLYQNTRPAITPSEVAGSDDGLMRAINTRHAQNIAAALAVYRRQDNADPDMLLLAEAALAAAEGETARAVTLYRQLYASRPDFLRARLDLARLLFDDRQNQEAAALFEGIDVPQVPALNQKVSAFRQALAERDAWAVGLTLGGGYDNNINQSSGDTVYRPYRQCGIGGDADACETQQLAASAPEPVGSRVWQYEASLKERQTLAGHHGIEWSAYAFGRIYPEHSEYGEHSVSLRPAYSFHNRNNQFAVGPVIQYAWSGGHLQNSSVGAGVSYAHEWSPDTSSFVQAEYRRDRYRDKLLSRFDGPQTLLSATTVYRLSNQWLLFGGYDYAGKNSRERVDSYRRHGIRAGVSAQTASGWQATAQAAWRKTGYRGYHGWLETQRQDIERSYRLELKHQRLGWKGFVPALDIRHTDNRSSSWLNRYRRSEFVLKIEKSF